MREEEKKRSSQDSSMKRLFKKRWVFPAIYIASAAIILTAVLWYQTSSTNNATDDNQYNYNATDIAGKKYNQPAIEVNSKLENFVMPVKDPNKAVIQKNFYDFDGSAEAQEAALISYNNSYYPNTGIDITMGKDETFDVVAALSGKVTDVREDSTLGNVIVIEHDDNVFTQYSSVKDFAVEVGEQVKQGQVIAKAGQSLFNDEAGVHVHFEIRKDKKPVNPISYFNKPVSALQEEKPADDKEATDDESKEEKSADDQNANQTEEGAGSGSDDKKDQDGDTSEKEESTDSSTNPS
jgi:stage II sporulation protein Q